MEPTVEIEKICEGLIDKLRENKLKFDAKKLKFAFEYALKVYGDSKRYKGETTPVTNIIPCGSLINSFIFCKFLGENPRLSKPFNDAE